MNPRPPDDPAESLHRLREQLVLAQVQIMELEDGGAECASRLAEIEALLTGAQTLADQKMDALAHLEKVHADLQAQFGQVRRLQATTDEALTDTRARLAAADARLAETGQRLENAAHRLEEQGRQFDRDLGEARAAAAARAQRIDQLDAEIRGMKASRSWRWTRVVRATERWLARRRSS
jgi:chromosome segregation ATPase